LQAFSVLPFQQTTDLVEKLRAQNVTFGELIIPDEIHDLLRWSDLGPRLPRHRRILPPQDGCLGRTPLSRDQEPIQRILRSL